ncbi:hypothetical protein DB31_4079 [Hyalangium minutum]|uniref:Uncharacterized protein n=1 Tax=Hyalangium minutum TaxID=394096 RepID=A0A085W3V6_9BACT|nr:hypothetical protein DB31_4079 [Hyalangium minutum]
MHPLSQQQRHRGGAEPAQGLSLPGEAPISTSAGQLEGHLPAFPIQGRNHLGEASAAHQLPPLVAGGQRQERLWGLLDDWRCAMSGAGQTWRQAAMARQTTHG